MDGPAVDSCVSGDLLQVDMSSKLEYLKRYQEKSSKKKRKKPDKNSNFTILDDDANWTSASAVSKSTELGEDPDDAPIVTQVRDDSVVKWKSWTTSQIVDDEDLSPPRRKRTGPSFDKGGEDLSPPRGKRTGPSFDRGGRDMSPPRGKRTGPSFDKGGKDLSPPRGKRTGPSVDRGGRDMSPPRGKRTGPSVDRGGRDMSPPRRKRTGPSIDKGGRDLSPPRKREKPSHIKVEDISPPRKQRANFPAHQEPTSKTVQFSWKEGEHRPGRTSVNLRQPQLPSKTPEDSRVHQPSQDTNPISRVVRRQRTDVHYSDPPAEPSSAEAQSNSDDKQFLEWGRGIAQTKKTFEKVVDEEYEMSKPLARYADDEDLEKMLKERKRDGDPMLLFMKKSKTVKQRVAGPKGKPCYKGDSAPNRFGLRPGYRWDGVDRSNGFEKTWIGQETNKKALQEESYKWSIEDM